MSSYESPANSLAKEHLILTPVGRDSFSGRQTAYAKKAGVQIEGGQRFGFHNLRHSLSNCLVSKAKIEPKTVQGVLRHRKIQTTLDLYAQEDGDETRAAQGRYLMALRAATQVL